MGQETTSRIDGKGENQIATGNIAGGQTAWKHIDISTHT